MTAPSSADKALACQYAARWLEEAADLAEAGVKHTDLTVIRHLRTVIIPSLRRRAKAIRRVKKGRRR